MSELLVQSLPESYTPTEEVPADGLVLSFTGDPRAEAMRVAVQCFSRKPDWVTFFRQVLGVNGVVRQLFSTPEQLSAFEQTGQYQEIQQMVAKLREQPTPPPDDKEPTRVITVRMPKSLHETLKQEAHAKETSMNQLCISKLLQVIDDELIPSE